MRAVVIDPDTGTVREIDTDASLASLQEIVGGYIEAVSVDAAHHCFVDEEARLKQPRPFFLLDNLPPLIGRGIVLGHDTDGNPAPCSLTLDGISARLRFNG